MLQIGGPRGGRQTAHPQIAARNASWARRRRSGAFLLVCMTRETGNKRNNAQQNVVIQNSTMVTAEREKKRKKEKKKGEKMRKNDRNVRRQPSYGESRHSAINETPPSLLKAHRS